MQDVNEYMHGNNNTNTKHLPSTVGEFNPLDHIKSCCSNSEFIEWRCSKFDPDSDLFDSLLGKFCKFNCKWWTEETASDEEMEEKKNERRERTL